MNGPLPPNGAPPPMRVNGMPPSPPISIAARSSNGGSPRPKQGPDGRMASGVPPGPGPGPRKYDARALEAQLADHHRVLKDYLTNSLREDHSYIPHNRARDKLLRLSPIQFQELSTDVYDELLRREDERAVRGTEGAQSVPRFLLPRNNFHPKRNQARQKLSTLAAKKFRELATDVLFELERRFPRFTGAERLAARSANRPGTSLGMAPPPIGPGMRRPSNASSIGPYSPSIIADGRGTPGPFSQQFQNNTMVPNKGTMVEDDDDRSGDDEDPYDLERSAMRSSRRTTNKSFSMMARDHPMNAEYQGQISDLEAKLAEMESQLHDKDKTVEAERERSSVLTENLERQLKSAEHMNGSLQNEIERLKSSGGGGEGSGEWRSRYESLEQEYREHQQVSDDVRQSADASLQEMRSLAHEVAQKGHAEQRLATRISVLESQIETWKSRHAKAQANLRSLRASSMGVYIQQPTAPHFAQHNKLLDSRGLIRDTSITRFQLTIDELLNLAHNGEPNEVLPYMRSVVASVRGITGDVSKAAPGSGDEAAMRRQKAAALIAAASNNLISTAKNHALSEGLAPVSLIDAAASHLTTAVVELIKLVKVRPSAEDDLQVGDDDFN